MNPNLSDLNIKIFADCADLASIERFAANPLIKGFTTNPTLMRLAGVTDYKTFALEALKLVGDRPISFEVFAEKTEDMYRQARAIASWGENVYVKIPVWDIAGQFTGDLIARLSGESVKVNVTAVFTREQVGATLSELAPNIPAIVSVFAGRIADTGRDAQAEMRAMRVMLEEYATQAELLWASTREVWNIFEANRAGCHVITVTPDVVAKLSIVGKDLNGYSYETVHQFDRDAKAAGYTIPLD